MRPGFPYRKGAFLRGKERPGGGRRETPVFRHARKCPIEPSDPTRPLSAKPTADFSRTEKRPRAVSVWGVIQLDGQAMAASPLCFTKESNFSEGPAGCFTFCSHLATVSLDTFR